MADSISFTTGTACLCCAIPAVLKCRIRGGTASLVGLAEYASPSSPPKKYRTETVGGSTAGCNVVRITCAPASAPAGFAFSWDGSGDYDISTGAFTDNAWERYYPTDGITICGSAAGYTISSHRGSPFNPSHVGTDSNSTQVKTQTTNTITFPGTCSIIWQTYLGTFTATLSNEDTESDGITRLFAGAPGTWGSWIVAGAAGCTSIPPTCCVARWQLRAAATFSWFYQESQARAEKSGMTPSTTYNVHFEIYRKPYGTGTYAWYQTLIVSATSDGAGFVTVDINVPNAQGYDSWCHDASLHL